METSTMRAKGMESSDFEEIKVETYQNEEEFLFSNPEPHLNGGVQKFEKPKHVYCDVI